MRITSDYLSIKSILIKPAAKLTLAFEGVAGRVRLSAGRNEKVINQKNLVQTKKRPRICVVYLASPRTHIHNKGFMGLEKPTPKIEILKESIKTTVDYLPNYPILVFHEDFIKEDLEGIRRAAKDRKVKFIKIDFKHYKGHDNLNEWMKKQKGFVEGRPAGYRMMCRFFSGVMQNHPALTPYNYYVRMDHDSFFIEPKALDIEECAKKYNFDYLYRSVWTDHKEKEGIWAFTKKYAKQNSLSLDGFRALKMLNLRGEFNGRAPYNNFHISKISFWRRKDVKKYLKAIENVDGSLKSHWHDTNVQSMLLGLFCPVVVEKTDFGYMHNMHYSLPGSLRIKYIGDKSAGE